MVSTVDALLVAGGLAGGLLCWYAYRVSRMPDRLGRLPFVAFAGLFGVGCLAAGTLGVLPAVFELPAGEVPWRLWTEVPLLTWLLATLPWFVFALQYTGTWTDVGRRRVLLVALPYAVFAVQLGLSALDGFASVGTLANAVGSALFIYIISLAVGGAYLLVQNTYAYGHVPLGQGASLVAAPVGALVLWNVIGMAGDAATTQAGAYAAGAWLAAVGLGAALFRYDLFESTPSIGTLGERALTRETEDLMFVVDDDDRIIAINETAVEALGTARPEAVGGPLEAVLDHDSGTLRRSETVAVQTTEGTRQYDPQVSAVCDHHGNDLGAMLSLRDVTERELREQRLAVLNRVLRHNLRNETDVVKSHAEALDGAESDHVDSIIDSADAIAALGQQAHRIDQYVSESAEDVSVDLVEVVRSVLETVGAAEAAVSVSVDLPPSATVVTNRQAVVSALESALDNAVSYADSAVGVTVERRPAGCTVRVTDDGPGIPESELDSLDTGTESPLGHSTGLGLWQLKWAVMTLNGELSFDTGEGTTVEIVVPDRGSDAARSPRAGA